MSALKKIWLIGDEFTEAMLLKHWPAATIPNPGIVSIRDLADLYQKLQYDNPDLLFLDLEFPGVSAPGFLKQMDDHLLGMPVIAIGSQESESIALRALESGVQDFLIKDELNSSQLARSILFSLRRKKNIQSLHDSEIRYRGLVDNIDGIVWEADTETFMFTFVSEQAERILGYPLHMWYEPAFWETHIHEEDRTWAVAYCAHQTSLGLGHEFEYRMIAQNGKDVWLRDIVTVVPREGKVPLLRGIMVDIGVRKKAEELLYHSSEQLRHLTAHLQHIREEERINIAREIHDQLGQQLTVMKMDLSWLQKKIDHPEALVGKKMRELMEVIDETVNTVRKISSDLRPSMLDDLGLVAALEWHSSEFQKRSGVKTFFSATDKEVVLPFDTTTGMYRIFQESLTNVARHADATKVDAKIEIEGSRLIMTISDNGKGFSLNNTDRRKTLGILGMRERVFIMNGDYSIDSVPGKGTTVQVSIPFANIE